MAMKTFVPGAFGIPADILDENGAVDSIIIDATGEAIACIWRSPIAGDIVSMQFRLGTVTTGSTISCEVQTVNISSGEPTGTLWATGTAKSFSLTTTMANTWQTVTFSAKATVAVGDTMALVVKRADTDGAGNFQINRVVTAMKGNYALASNTLAAWTKQSATMACIIPNYSETAAVASYGQFAPGAPSIISLSAGATNDELGNTFTLPFRARASGFWLQPASLSAGTTVKVRLYNTDGSTVMASRTMDGDQVRAGANANQRISLPFESATVLAADSVYRLAVFVSVGTIIMANFSLADVTAMNCLHLGSLCAATVRADAGAWSNVPQLRYDCGIIIDQLDDSSASGGAASGLAHIIGGQ